MTDSVNKLTLNLAKYYLEQNRGVNTISVSGYLAYFTLLLVNTGLQGQAKYDLSAFLDCNYSYLQFSECYKFLEYECIHSFTIDEFSMIGRVKSAIFHSSPPVEDFKRIAYESYDFEHISIHPTDGARQYYAMEYWTELLKNVPISRILPESVYTELKLMILHEYIVSFKWLKPAKARYTQIAPFTDLYSRIIPVKMMRMIDYYKCFHDDDVRASILFIDLETNGTYAVVVLPYLNENIMDVIKRLNVFYHNI
ncbi:hypothetical protein RF11_08240 [Thelohanellus kitauei]|uniref:Serpin domain-containing protein n=1 Tax=Thelohanellus kitauei TaxID=669202 RepID=A0A0C2NBD8_THEKT|nr:hypothetical protein RF11_08240 [Thelohanellus kitauei]